MWQRDMNSRGKFATLGCIAALFVFMQSSHAAPAKKPVRHITQHSVAARHVAVRHDIVHSHGVIRRADIHRVAVRHQPIGHHVVEKPLYHHAIYHRVAAHRPDYRHGYVTHPYVHHYVHHADYLWCVPYAREISHIDLKGDAFLWWAEAAGRYGRGNRPQIGSVLNFRSSARIPMGHVAVVEQVVNSREVLVDQANWVPDSVSHDVPVIDVSPNNNWSNVQVSIGGGRFGTSYPTYGFIYPQAPGRVIYAANGGATTEVAEAPVVHKIRLVAPNRTLR